MNPVDEYIESLPEDRISAVKELRRVILENLPGGFEERMCNGMPSYVVPHSVYPKGYHVDPSKPLAMMSFASQKNYISLYHMPLYANKKLLEWFREEYSKHSKTKLDMGKSCIHFKKMNDIPYWLIGKLVGKVSVRDFISSYEKALNRNS